MRRKLAMDERLEELRRQLDQKTTEIESLAAAIKAWAASKIWNRLSTKGWSRPWRKRGFGLVPPVLQPKKAHVFKDVFRS
jgi:hypothetical protein